MKKILKKLLLASAGIAMAAVPQLARAQAVITEIMYDPAGTDSGREWIEIYNTSDTAIPLISWKLYVDSARHNIAAVSDGASLAPQSFAVIAANAATFQRDYPDYSGALFHAAISLNNSGAAIALRDASSTVIDSVSYGSSSGGLNDGNSLQRPPDHAAQFSPYAPSPGAGLSTVMIPPKAKAVLSRAAKPQSTKKESSSTIDSDDSSDSYPAADNADESITSSSAESQVAAADQASAGDGYWWYAAGALGIVTGGALVVSRRFKKTEWDIVEEKPEDV